MAIGFSGSGPALGAEASLGEAVRAADAKYLKPPKAAMADKSPKIVVGGGEEGLLPQAEEISQGHVRVTLTYIEEEPEPGNDPTTDELPGDAEEAPAAAAPTEDEPPAEEVVPLEDIPEEATLPGEFNLGETVWRTPVVTVYFDGPSPASPEAQDDGPETGTDQSQGSDDPAEDGPEDATAAPAGARVVARLEGPAAGVADPPVSVQLAELDPTNAHPEVVVSFFTGGAHCCSMTRVVAGNADGSEWSTIDVGEFDGGPMLAVDLDGDGAYEFETRDNNFLYAFACYACSQAPLQVLALEDGKIENVSADPRFKKAHAAWLTNMIVGVPEEEVNGFLAGYVAQKIRLGEGKQAWKLMLEHFDRNTDWGLEYCEQERDENGECPGKTIKSTFPQALERMLKKNSYMIGG